MSTTKCHYDTVFSTKNCKLNTQNVYLRVELSLLYIYDTFYLSNSFELSVESTALQHSCLSAPTPSSTPAIQHSDAAIFAELPMKQCTVFILGCRSLKLLVFNAYCSWKIFFLFFKETVFLFSGWYSREGLIVRKSPPPHGCSPHNRNATGVMTNTVLRRVIVKESLTRTFLFNKKLLVCS